MCVACTLLLWLNYVCLQSSWLHWLSLLWARFGPCAIKGLVWGCLGFVVGSSQVLALHKFSGTLVTPNCRTVSLLCCPLRSFCWQAGPVVRLDVCPQPVWWGSVTLSLRALFLCCFLERFCWSVEPAVRVDVNNRAYSLGCSWTGVYSYLPLSLGQESLWSGAGHCCGCLQNEVSQLPLWKDSCQVGRVG